MTEKLIHDGGGASLRVIDYNGDLLQPFPDIDKRIEDLPNMRVRKDDTIVIGHPKSGNHWVWEMTARLITHDTSPTFPMYMGEFLIDARPDDYVYNHTSPRVFSSHLQSHHISLAKGLFDGKHKIVYVARNPKDVAVSFYTQTFNFKTLYGYDGRWDDFFELFIQGNVDCGPWFNHVLGWEKYKDDHPQLPIHFIMYEDLKKDLMGEIKKLASFLELKRDEDFYQRLYNVSLFPAMKKHHDEMAPDYIRVLYRNGDLTMFRKGIVGDWKNFFTEDQSKRFDAVFNAKMKESKWKFRFSDDISWKLS